MYAVGAKVVHPCHGAGTIVRIQSKSIGAQPSTYYVIRTVGRAMQIMVPVERAESMGLRDVGLVEALRGLLVERCTPPEGGDIEKDFRTRQNSLHELLKSGSFEDVTEAVRVLFFLNAQRPLGMTDRQMFDSGKQMLASELALASDQEMDVAMHELENRLAYITGLG